MNKKKTGMAVWIGFWVIFVIPLTFAQSRYSSFMDVLAKAGRLNGQGGPQSVNWIRDGNQFSYIRSAGKINTYNPSTALDEEVFDGSALKFPGKEDAFNYNAFEWTADFNYLLFTTNFRQVWRNSGNADYYLYSLKDKSLRLVARDAYTAQVSPDGKSVAYERNGNLFVLDLATKKEKQLTKDGTTAIYNGRFGWVYEEEFGLVRAWEWNPDSKSIAFWHVDETAIPFYSYSDLSGMHPEYKKIPYPRVGDPVPLVKIGIVEIRKAKTTWASVPMNGGFIPRIYWTSKPNTLAIVRLDRKQRVLDLFMVDAKTGTATNIMTEDSKGWMDVYNFFSGILHHFFFPPQVNEFYWISDRNGYQHVYRYDYTGKLLGQVTEGLWDVMTVESLDIKNGLLYYTSTEASGLERHLYVIGLNGSSKRKITETAGRHIIQFAPGGQYFIDTWSNTTTPKQVEIRNVNGQLNKLWQANESVKEFIKTQVYAPKTLEIITTADGRKLDVYLIKPIGIDSTQKYPLVLSVYGGPSSQSVYNSWGANPYEQYLAQNGYAIAAVNNRGSSGYGRDFMEGVYEQLGKLETEDFVATADALAKKHNWLDRSRMAIQGHSYGGFTTCYTLTKHPGTFKLGIAGAPVTQQKLYDNIYAERYMGILPENEQKYQDHAPMNFVQNLKDPLLIAHALEDDNVHVINTFQFIRAATDAGKDVELRIYPPGHHGVAYSATSQVRLWQTYLDFLDRWLKK
ncbi:MAG: S9 family peptidase [Saprospiraceae bacterium]|nr:S9 family peptidase [Saprospiraceae bacterium]